MRAGLWFGEGTEANTKGTRKYLRAKDTLTVLTLVTVSSHVEQSTILYTSNVDHFLYVTYYYYFIEVNLGDS